MICISNINKKHLEYYYANRDIELLKNKELITCECGCEISRINIARHKKSKKHKKYRNQADTINLNAKDQFDGILIGY